MAKRTHFPKDMIIGQTFLRNYPSSEKLHEVGDDRVIIEKKDWERVGLFLNENNDVRVRLTEYLFTNFETNERR